MIKYIMMLMMIGCASTEEVVLDTGCSYLSKDQAVYGAVDLMKEQCGCSSSDQLSSHTYLCVNMYGVVKAEPRYGHRMTIRCQPCGRARIKIK